MKNLKIIYWIATILVAAMMGFGAYSYFTNPEMAAGFKLMGFPPFFKDLLGTGKIFGVLAIVQQKCKTLQEWAYAGFTIVLISATWTHLATSTPFHMPIIVFLVLMVSYFTRIKIMKAKEAK